MGGIRAVDRADRLHGRATREGAERAEEPLRGRIEEVVAPGDSVAQGLLARGEIARAAAEQAELVAEPRQDRRRAEERDPRRRQLDRQRQAVDPATIAAIVAAFWSVRANSGRTARARATKRAAACAAPTRWASCAPSGAGSVNGATGKRLSPRTRQGVAARRQHAQVGAGLQQFGEQRCGGDHLLAIVQDQQEVAVAEGVVQQADQRLAGHLRQRQRLGERRADERRVGDRGQIDEGDVVAVAARCRAASASASRVLPIPPGPISVRSRQPGCGQDGVDGAQPPPARAAG